MLVVRYKLAVAVDSGGFSKFSEIKACTSVAECLEIK